MFTRYLHIEAYMILEGFERMFNYSVFESTHVAICIMTLYTLQMFKDFAT